MAGPYPLATLAAQITTAGISAPAYADILASLQASFYAIYGSSAYITPDSQDGQLLAIFAKAINDANNTAIAVYNAYSPSTAQGANLSSVVKINGLKRNIATNSTALGNVVGTVGTIINNGVVQDANGNLWNLPATVTIPSGGSISVTVTAQQLGNIVAPSGTINKINTPTLGWQSFVSTADAVAGAAVETDAALRGRQSLSAAIIAVTPVGAVYSALANIAGVTAVRVYENATSAVDSNGLPAKSIAAVVAGGTGPLIAAAIGQKKTPGAATFGTSSAVYTDPTSGIVYTINYSVPVQDTVKVNITVKGLTGYTSLVTTEIQNAVAAYINALGIGTAVLFSKLYPAAYLNGGVDAATFEITALTSALNAGAFGTTDLTIAYNHVANCIAANVVVTVT